MTTEQQLAAFVAELDPTSIPDTVQDRARLTVADTVGAIVGGSSESDVQALAETWATRANGSSDSLDGATVLGTPHRITPHHAAFCNGTAGTVLELDEGHRFAAGHPAIHLLPALLAAGEHSGVDAETFLTAFIAGYEVAVRAALTMGPIQAHYHPHGLWGTVGGAAAVAKLRGCDAKTTRHAMAIAANDAQHTRFEAATEGATVRNGYAGMANLAALIAVDQAQAGVAGLKNGVARHLELAGTRTPETNELTDGLGDRWELSRGYFKVHAACRYTHAVLDAVSSLGRVNPKRIDSVTVETYPAAAQLTERRPKNALQAKFSIPFAVATALCTGETGQVAFSEEALTPETLSLAERVSVMVADDIAARAPDQRGARLTIDTATETIEREVVAAQGGEHNPFSESRLHEKFMALTTPVIGDDATELWESARTNPAPSRLCSLARPR